VGYAAAGTDIRNHTTTCCRLHGVGQYTRRDTDHANPDHRPTAAQYDRYIWLVQHFRSHEWDNRVLHDASPFRVVDPGFNAILIRACADLAKVATELELHEIAARNQQWALDGLAAMETLWSDRHHQYLCFDRVSGELIDSASIGGLLPAAQIAERIRHISANHTYLVTSHDPQHSAYDGRRYWRGPAWLIVNYMLIDGLHSSGQQALAEEITASSLALIEHAGFAEYYDPSTGEPCGGGSFTWTAAMVLEFLSTQS